MGWEWQSPLNLLHLLGLEHVGGPNGPVLMGWDGLKRTFEEAGCFDQHLALTLHLDRQPSLFVVERAFACLPHDVAFQLVLYVVHPLQHGLLVRV